MWRATVFSVAILALFAVPASAGYRSFTFTYDTYPMTKGSFELEQWVTYKGHTEDESDFMRFDFREELEFAPADNVRLGFYLPSWRYEDSKEQNGTNFESVGVEAILLLSNPVTDAVGFGLYGEVNVGEHEVEFEQKLLLHKDWGKWTLAYNFVLETELEGVGSDEETEVEGVIGHTFGLSYSVSPKWRLGGELVIESVYEDWNEYEGTTVYAGPVFSYQGDKVFGTKATWWTTLTPTVELSGNDEEPDFQVRLIVGLEL